MQIFQNKIQIFQNKIQIFQNKIQIWNWSYYSSKCKIHTKMAERMLIDKMNLDKSPMFKPTILLCF